MRERAEQYKNYDPICDRIAERHEQMEADMRRDASARQREIAGPYWPVCTKCGRDEPRTATERIWRTCPTCGGGWSR